MLRFAADEDFNNDIVRGVLRRRPDLNIVRIQDHDLSGKDRSSTLAVNSFSGVKRTSVFREAPESVFPGQRLYRSIPGSPPRG